MCWICFCKGVILEGGQAERQREAFGHFFCFLLPHSSHPHGKMEALLCLIPRGGIWGVKKKPQRFAGKIKGIAPLVGEQEGGANPPSHLKPCQSPKLLPGPFYFEKILFSDIRWYEFADLVNKQLTSVGTVLITDETKLESNWKNVLVWLPAYTIYKPCNSVSPSSCPW